MFKQLPTPKQVTDAQLVATMEYFNCDMDIELAKLDGDTKTIELIEEQKAEQKVLHKTPVNLADCQIVEQLAVIRLTNEALDNHKESVKQKCSYYDERDIKFNHFILMGEVAQAQGHIVVVGTSSKQTYIMVHSSDFEIIPTQEC